MLEKYSDIFISDDYKYYKFIGVGINGSITKVVRYYDLDLKDYYNLGFGDQDPVTGDLDDLVISDNGDSEKVLATVAMTVFSFTSRYPKAKVYITGSTGARTRLYRMGINRHPCSIEMHFKVQGLLNGRFLEKMLRMRRFLSQKSSKLVDMKIKTKGKKLPKGFKIDPNLAERYANEPLFVKKAEKANATLKAVGVPKGW